MINELKNALKGLIQRIPPFDESLTNETFKPAAYVGREGTDLGLLRTPDFRKILGNPEKKALFLQSKTSNRLV